MSTVLNTIEALATHTSFKGLTVRQCAVLGACYKQPEATPYTVRALATHLKLNRPAISRAVDALQADNLVVRKPDPKDGRSLFLVITKTGRKAIDNLTRSITLGG